MTTLRAGSATHVGQVRSNNQDSVLVVAQHDLYGVADGMGGHRGGGVASARAVELIPQQPLERTLDSLKDAVRVANRAIFEQAGADRDLHGMGTTLCAVMVVDGDEGDEIAWVNVGDSRVYLYRDDRLIQLSQDHSLVEDLLRDGQLTPEEAAVHPQRNIITRALGIDVDVAVDGGTVLPFTGDRFLVCSDGVFNEVTVDQITSVLRRLADPGDACDELVRLANDSGGRDNITAVLVDVTDDGGRAAAASALLAEREGTVEGHAEPVVTQELEQPRPRGVVDDGDAFAGRRSSLPEAHDDYGAEHDELYLGLDDARTRRFTWRVVAFVLALLAIVGVAFGAIWWSANNTYYVAFRNDRVVVYQGKPGGVLWFDPQLDSTTTITRDDVPPAVREQIDKNKTFGSQAEVQRYLLNVQTQVNEATTTTTSPSTTVPATTTVPGTATTGAAGATTTTVP